MGENGKRLGRMFGYSWRGRAAALSGLGAIAIALVMMGSPAATAANAGIVIHAKYHGAVSPDNYIDTGGCAKVKVQKPWNFKTKTGIGGSENTGKAVACAKTQNGVGQEGYADADGGFEVAIPLKIPSSTSSVALNTAWKVSASLKATDGYSGSATPVCNAPLYTWDYSDADYYWNYTSSYGFSDYNYSYYDDYDGQIYSYSYGNAPTPSPFNQNATSYEFVYSDYGADSSCYVYAEEYLELYADLVDESSGAYMSQTGSTVGSYGDVFDVFTEIYNQTYWYCYSETYWYGPSNYSYYAPLTCYSSNTTLTSVVYNYVPSFSYSTGANNTVSMSLSTSGSGSFWWNDTFVGSDHYTMLFNAYGGGYADNDWKKGSGSWVFNAATLGNGINLKSITIT